MADNVLSIVDPVALTLFTRGIDPATYDFTLDRFFPVVTHESTEYEFRVWNEQRAEMAGYRPYDVESDIGKRQGWEKVRGAIPPISRKMTLGEAEKLRLYALRGQDVDGQLVDQVYDDAALLTEAILARFEFARGQLLSTGKITFTGFDREGMIGDIDFGVPAGNFLDAGVAWDDYTNADAVTDLKAMVARFKLMNGGRRPAGFLTSDTMRGHLTQHLKLRNQVINSTGNAPTSITDDVVDTFLRIQGLPPFYPTYDTEVNVAGSSTRVIAENLVVATPVPSPRFGETYTGITAESIKMVENGIIVLQQAPNLIGQVRQTDDPVHTWTHVAAAAMPILKDPHGLVVLDAMPEE